MMFVVNSFSWSPRQSGAILGLLQSSGIVSFQGSDFPASQNCPESIEINLILEYLLCTDGPITKNGVESNKLYMLKQSWEKLCTPLWSGRRAEQARSPVQGWV